LEGPGKGFLRKSSPLSPGWRKLSDTVCYVREGTYEVYDLAQMNFHTAFIHVGVPCRVTDGLQELALVHL
jgi:hypothetical protein